MKVLFASGGTGGHLFPAIAVASELRDLSPETEIVFVGAGKSLEQKLTREAGFISFKLIALPFRGVGLLGLLKLAFMFPLAIIQALFFLHRQKPNVVVGFGGFPSFVPVLTAWMLCIPIVLHEQNATVGLANKVLSVFAKHVFAPPYCNGFPSYVKFSEVINPVRKVFSQIPLWNLSSASKQLTLLVMGGSQGAVSLNTGVLSLLSLFRKFNVKVLHQTGEQDYERVKLIYEKAGFSDVELFSFVNNIAEFYRKADLIISRAGAMSVAEITMSGRAAVYVPLRIANAHQYGNVKALVNVGAALVVEQGEGFEKRLETQLSELLEMPNKIKEIADKCQEISSRYGGGSSRIIAEAIMESNV